MADQNDSATTTDPRASRRQAKAHRILDAAADLILRWGYNKTTMDDIARQAGVAKGTVYLYWKSREDLFRALIARESVVVGDDVRQRIVADPAGVTLRGIYKHAALALMKRPLMKAVLLRDMDVLGRLAQDTFATDSYAERLAGFNVYLEFLRQRGLVRTDMSLAAQVVTSSAIIMGFFLTAPLLPPELALSDEEIADLIGEAVHRALETDRPIPFEEYQTISRAFLEYYDRIMAAAHEQLRREIGL